MSELLYTQEQLIQTRNDNYNAGVKTERERILAAVEKLRPHIDENGVNWIPQFNTIIAAIKGENK